MSIIIGLDIGYGYTKAVTSEDGRNAVFPSVIGPAVKIAYESEMAQVNPGGGTYTVGGSDWFVGDLARLQVPRDQQIAPQARERTNMAFMRVALCAALQKLGIDGGQEVKVVTGLPVRWYGDRETLEERVSGAQSWRLDGKPKSAWITDVLVIPQPVGSYFAAILDHKGAIVNETLATGRVGVLDVGMHTTDYVLLDGLRYIETASGSIEVAMGTAYAQIARALREQFGLDKTIHDVDHIMRNGHKVSVYGKEHDTYDLEWPVLQSVAEMILGQVATAWGDGRDIHRVIVSGGGALQMGHFVSKRYPHATTHAQPVLANVWGFLRYGQRKFAGSAQRIS